MPASAPTIARDRADHALFLVICAGFVAVWTTHIAFRIRADTWLDLTAGREIVQHGLPHFDHLAVLSDGRPWVDQQWLAHLAWYGIYRLGGLDLVVTTNALLLLAALALSLRIARSRGATATRTIPFLLVGFFYLTSFARAETFALVLFVALLAILTKENRRRSRRILFAFPLLILWANVHGSVVIGAILVALLGGVELASAWRRRERAVSEIATAAALVVMPFMCVFASPYGIELVSYYRSTIRNGALPKITSEWAPASPTDSMGAPLYLLGFVALAILLKRRGGLTAFEVGTLVLTFAAAARAERSIVWFVYAALILVSPVLEEIWPHRAAGPRRKTLDVSAAAVATVFALVLFGKALVAPRAAYSSVWPTAAAERVARLIDAHRGANVVSTPKYADWLLFRVPSLRGRIAFDGRWEILRPSQLESVFGWLRGRPAPAAIRAYSIVVLDPREDGAFANALGLTAKVRVVYRSPTVAVLARA